MNDKKIVFATGNEGKMQEIREILKDLGMEILSMKEAGAILDIVEDGATFGENAEIKARAVWKRTGGIVLADDSGLVVDCLNGEPGILSARYMGEDTSYEIKNQNILDRAAHARGGERSARFICNIAAVLPDGTVLHTEEAMEGLLADQPAGKEGFGYDPILYIPEFGVTSAQLTLEQKNKISHRGKALEAMKGRLIETFTGGENNENTDCQ
ncbi:RdgB/HAM1 family non-canonical purine NTP pyrophosphatase [Lacrimispora celerecrescens]|uniref:dITP/XTP pyrophosphatase n=1 Tax=Lacrimispora celerecrescens TaxID=29354 RepID=A0A084JLL5_9FIRM|nr:RdgB/HAM1 family non-canonical purine NTP pyrophosphatase [Lacrimispora celerecrescens]KEZ89849.1 NTP phosphatase [Lacrimispora celerecrescens]